VVWLTVRYGASWGMDVWMQGGAAVAVFLGHVFSIFLRGKGGKGVATAAGVLLGLPAMSRMRTGKGDHRAIVGTQFQLGEKHFESSLPGFRVEPLAQRAIGANAASHHQSLQAGLLQRPRAFAAQHLDHGDLKRRGDIGACRLPGLLAQRSAPPS
jgi:hypothetical protein